MSKDGRQDGIEIERQAEPLHRPSPKRLELPPTERNYRSAVLLQLLEQPHVLDRDDGLVGERSSAIPLA